MFPLLLNLLHPHDGGDASYVDIEPCRHGLERQGPLHNGLPDGLTRRLRQYRLADEVGVLGERVNGFGGLLVLLTGPSLPEIARAGALVVPELRVFLEPFPKHLLRDSEPARGGGGEGRRLLLVSALLRM